MCEYQGDEIVKPYATTTIDVLATEDEQYDAYISIREKFSDGSGSKERTARLREADIAGCVEALANSEAEYIKTFSPDTF